MIETRVVYEVWVHDGKKWHQKIDLPLDQALEIVKKEIQKRNHVEVKPRF